MNHLSPRRASFVHVWRFAIPLFSLSLSLSLSRERELLSISYHSLSVFFLLLDGRVFFLSRSMPTRLQRLIDRRRGEENSPESGMREREKERIENGELKLRIRLVFGHRELRFPSLWNRAKPSPPAINSFRAFVYSAGKSRAARRVLHCPRPSRRDVTRRAFDQSAYSFSFLSAALIFPRRFSSFQLEREYFWQIFRDIQRIRRSVAGSRWSLSFNYTALADFHAWNVANGSSNFNSCNFIIYFFLYMPVQYERFSQLKDPRFIIEEQSTQKLRKFWNSAVFLLFLLMVCLKIVQNFGLRSHNLEK